MERKFNFNGLFNAFESMGLPSPIKDEEFRAAMIKALNTLYEESEAAPSTETFEFNEEDFKRYQKILEQDRTEYDKNSINRAADYLIKAWEGGYTKSINKTREN